MPHGASVRRETRFTAAFQVAVLILIGWMGVVHLAYPFSGDQALFLVGAEKMHAGAALYRDFWDIKQPGIYLFYLAGGSLFGFSETGIHLFELLYLLSFAIVLQRTLQGCYDHPWIAPLVPLLVVGTYYLVAGANVLTQVEALAGFPIYLSAFFAQRGLRGGRSRVPLLLCAGVCASLALLLKLLFALIVASLWAVVFTSERRRLPSHIVAANVLTLSAGLIGSTIAIGSVLCLTSGARLVYDTFVTIPMQIVATFPSDVRRLGYAVFWYVTVTFPLLVLAATGILLKARLRGDRILTGSLVWFASGALVILLQRQSWWAYQTVLLMPPAGLSAARGLDVLAAWCTRNSRRSLRRRAAIAAIGVCVLFLPYDLKAMQKSLVFARNSFALSPQSQESYRERVSETYRATASDTAFLFGSSALPGDIYVFGNPLYYVRSHRSQAVAINGWALEFLLPAQWSKLDDELRAAAPAYLFVASNYAALIVARSPALAEFLDAKYRVRSRAPSGTWYVRKAPAAVTSAASP